MQTLSHQRGAVLVISLLLLIAMTLLGVSAINSSTVNLMIVGNLQSQQEAEAQTQEGIEAVLSSMAVFDAPPGAPFTQGVSNGRSITIEEVTCRSSDIADGYSATMQIVPEINTWLVSARHADTETGQVRIRQGVRIRQPANRCP